MKYDNSRAFEKHLEGAAPHHFSRLYFILSKDPVEQQEAVEHTLHALHPSPNVLEESIEIIDGTQTTLDMLFSELYSHNLFADKRLFWIQNADKLKKNLIEALEKYFPQIPSSQYLILSAPSWNKQTSFYKAAEKEGIILELTEPKPWEKEKKLIEWASKQLSAKRKIIPYQVCQLLVKQTGLDSSLLIQEIEKLLCYIGDRNEITQQDIIKICNYQPSDTIWQLGEALFKRDGLAAILIAQSLLTEGQSLLPLLRQIRSQFQTQFHICVMLANGKAAQEISHEFPYLKGNLLDRTIQQAQRYGLDSLRQGILFIDNTEMRVKNSHADEKLLMELLMIQLTRTI
ncbi:DNA polymerase III subunit delta [Candidatus Protochlamydia amoebophila]|uniref:DNA polymerase III subunit delta n=1 Tax=Candidatus Protochlamydia amoebophila TaxID=362787 RepID=UPI000035313D|nr:DNA polymerase III subunit delta [Candidatus Protochlamydia amoebophila]